MSVNGQNGLTSVAPVDAAAAALAREAVDALAKPPGSLGRMEDLAVQLAGIAGVCPPPVPHDPVALVFAADHGVVARGVSRWPREVTAAMVAQLLAGRAACNAIARTVGARVVVTDVGVATPVAPHPDLVSRAVAPGTADMLQGPAMTAHEMARAVQVGVDVARAAVEAGAGVVCVGDMGIGNTTAAAALVAAYTGAGAADVVGRGAASDDATVERKRDVVAQSLRRHPSRDPGAVLANLGGFEHAGMAGAVLACALARVPVVLDGVNADAAALAAAAMWPATRGYMIAGHRSREPGAAAALGHLGLDAVIDLDMRLGEGTGALLAVPVIQAAARVLHDMARLDEVAG